MAVPQERLFALFFWSVVLTIAGLLFSVQNVSKSRIRTSSEKSTSYVQNVPANPNKTVEFTTNTTFMFNISYLSYLRQFCDDVASKAPHLSTSFPEAILPKTWIGKTSQRAKVQLVFGVATKPRPVVGNYYAEKTLRKLLSSLTKKQRKRSLIMVMVAGTESEEIQNSTTFLRTTFHKEIQSGVLHIVVPHRSFYILHWQTPCNQTAKQPRCDYQIWRNKQNLDFAYMMVHGSVRANYYMQLEDDMVCDSDFTTSTFLAIDQHKYYPWILAEATMQGSFRGKMLRSKDAFLLAKDLVLHFDQIPCDWLLEEYLNKQPDPCAALTAQFPSGTLCSVKKRKRIGRDDLCIHMGKFSSLQGKIAQDVV